MQRSSETIGEIAGALAKAQCELDNPERTLTATIADRGSKRSFRYASLASGLELVRKSLGQQDIAVVQSTALEQGQIMLTTLLVHASGEWISSLWPVCPASESSAHVKGAALTYARRYALFTLVGIAGEDDLDAPDIPHSEHSTPDRAPPRKGSSNGTARAPPVREGDASGSLRDRLLREIAETAGEEALALWAKRALPLKNGLSDADARAVEAAYLAKLALPEAPPSASVLIGETPAPESPPPPAHIASTPAMPLPKPIRRRNKAHLGIVASRPCLICKASPCDAHHLKMAQSQSLGRKVSDEFTVPLCRRHHRELHRHGNERAWWQNQGIDPLPIAAELWERTQDVPGSPEQFAKRLGRKPNTDADRTKGLRPGSSGQNDETKPIPRAEA